MKMKHWKKKQWIFMVVWCVTYVATLQFFRFKFGLFEITGAFVAIGLLLTWLLGRSSKPKSI